MKYVFVNGISFDNIVSDLKDADYGFHFLWSLVTVFVCVLEWICVQDRWKSDIQDLIENTRELSKTKRKQESNGLMGLWHKKGNN